MNKDTRLSDVLHVLLHMAQVKEPLTSEVLARSMGTNPAVFRRTMAGLRREGHVISGKGHGGGWQLARPLEEITLLAIYEALERPTLFAIGSRGRHPQCRIEDAVNSALAAAMRQAQSLLLERFGQVTLNQLMPSPREVLTQTCGSVVPATPHGD
ncbi:Rrf2 family transcriptional regulator [Affinirhizobium pseudoryzae]|uniref:Rrf2 family transcriptional regulator n=1 Tax=Allorhizobium pseudoryzae TaxID=379684 RepID=UPI0013EAE169|nr:Rrf2 family transcriptional regulator [Allorhizobium pseudoryzae]